jgi:hypothetical protein
MHYPCDLRETNRIMMQQTSFKRRYTCGQHVAGHGRQISTHREAVTSGKACVILKGVITGLPGKADDPYTVLDEQTFITLEAQEEHLRPL